MATGGLYGSTTTGDLVATSGAESTGLYGNNTNIGGTYFEWFIFQESATAPATPTGGSWNFLTNTGTPPSGWSSAPPTNPTHTVWASISIVNSRSPAALTWTTPATWVSGGISNLISTDGSVTITAPSTDTRDLSVAVAAATNNVICQVRNTTGATLTKGTVVYITGATGQIPTVSKALATSDTTSAQTLGMMTADLANNSNGNVTIIGLITDIDTSAYTDGAQLYLSGTTAGGVTTTKPYAPIHLVYVGVVEYAHAIHGKIFVKVQNGYELDELHNVSAQSPTTGQTIVYNSSTGLWEKNTVSLTAGVNGTLPVANGGTGLTTAPTNGQIDIGSTGVGFVRTTLTAGTGISVTNAAGAITITNTSPSSGGTVTSVTGTSPVASSGGTTPAISLSSGYGDTQNPYASKTANFFLAAPNGIAGVPTFRAVVAADIPTLNQNTTGTAANVTGIVAAANGGTGQSSYAVGDLLYASTTTDLSKLADVATGNALISGGVGVAPSYGKIGLATHVSGTLPTANGGTNLTSFTANGVVYASSTSALTTGAALTFNGSNLTVGSSSVNGVIYLNSATASNTSIIFQTNGSTVANFLSAPGSGGMFYDVVTGNNHIFRINNAEQMRLTSTGLGIGTSSPGQKLEVAGNVYLNTATPQLILNRSATTSASYAKFQTAGTNNWGIGQSIAASGTNLEFYNFATSSDAMVLDTSGNLGIGTSSPSYKLDVLNNTVRFGSAYVQGASGRIGMFLNNPADNAFALNRGSDNTEYMRFDSSGNLLVGTTGTGYTNADSFTLEKANGYEVINHSTSRTSGAAYILFGYNTGGIGSITQSGTTAVLYNTTSDQRLKENIVDAPEFGSVIDAIQVRSYDWKADGSHQRAGFVAQELVTVAPEAVNQPADPEEMMAVDYSKLVPMLVKEIQSLRKRLAALEK